MKIMEKFARIFHKVERSEKAPPVETLLLHSEAQRLAQAKHEQEKTAAELLRKMVCANNKEAQR